jgi:iron complex outermembrane recepter protein
MRLHILARCSVSAAALLAAVPALAQDDPAAPAQASPDVAVDVPVEEEEEANIVVMGVREALQSQQNIRRNSDQIVDAIVAEDIGKLPDIAVSDTAARIPGVQVERGGGEAGRVLVRGLPDFTTTYNGREIFTAETRSVALQDFPSGLIGAIEVFKTSSADLVEPGLAGLVNVRSRRPFDFDPGLNIAGSVWGLYTHQADEITPNGNLVLSNRWDVGDGGEIGALIGFSYTRLRYLDSTRSNTDFVAGGGPNGTRFPDIQRLTYGEGDRTRPSINAAIQWRPNPDVELYVEGLWQGFRNRVSDRETSVPLWGGSGFSNVETQDGRTDLLESATVTNPFRPDGFQGGTFNKTDTYQVAVGGSWDLGPVRLSADIARTDSTFTGSTASVDFAFRDRQTVSFDTDIEGNDGGAEFSFANFDPSNPANYVYRGFYEEAQVAEGDDWQARLDLDWETGMALIPQVEVGIRYTDRDSHREFGNRYWNFEGNQLPFSAVPLDYALFDAGFRGNNSQQGYRTWLSPTYDSIRANLAALRQFNMGLGGTAFGPNTDTAPTSDPLQTWDATEQHLAGYVQIRYEIPLGGEMTIDGNIGLRFVQTDLSLTGTRRVFPAGGGPSVLTPTDIDREFDALLPSFNARIRFTPQFQARLSFTQTQTRPSFIDLRASGTLDQPPTCLSQNPVPENCFLTGNGGNPFLNPLESDNYDAALEYYFSRNGFVSLSVFRRDMNGFIENTVFQGTTETGTPLRLAGPVNSGAGRIQGFEIQGTTFFDFLGAPQFGVQANLTHLDANADFNYDEGFVNGVRRVDTVNRELLGVSSWSYNLVGIYEAGGLSARLAYNWRSSFPLTYQRRGDHLYTEEADPVSRLDLSASYDILENLTIFADWTNILGDPFTSTLTRVDTQGGNGPPTGFEATFPRVVRYEETTVSLGARFRF